MGFLTGKTAIITGAGRAVLEDGSCGSIGYGIATAYAKEGANLVITGRNVKKLEAAKDELERLYGIKVLTVQADVNAGADNEAVVNNVVKQAMDTYGRIDVLINNAGVFSKTKQRTKDGFEQQFGVNYLGHFLLTQKLLPVLRQATSSYCSSCFDCALGRFN